MRIRNKFPFTNQKEIVAEYDNLYKQVGRLRDSDRSYRWILSRFNYHKGQKLLDVACGEGILVNYAIEAGLNAQGIDISLEGALKAHKLVQKNVIVIANGEFLPYKSESFELVTNLGSLEHFLSPKDGLLEMKRVLRNGGQAALLLPNSYYLADIIWEVWRTGYSPSHNQPLERFATYREWRDLIEENGFKVTKAYKYNFMFPKTKSDWGWYLSRPTRIIKLIFGFITPFNLSNHFLFICSTE